MMDFLKSIENAHKVPDVTREGVGGIPDGFASFFSGPQAIERVEDGATDAVAGATRYNFKFRCARLVIGKEQVDFSNGEAIYESHDDSERLSEIMNASLEGRVVINKKLESFLKDGTMVIWVEWLEPLDLGPKKTDALTLEQLLSPDPLSDESQELTESTAKESG